MDKEILIVEDNHRFRHSIKLLLGNTDYKFYEASSVSEGLRLLEGRPTVRVIILDLAFPGGSGADLLKSIEDRRSNYRVIVLTAHDEMFAAEVAKSFEVFAYMSKSAQSLREPLRFQVAAAFNDLERAWLQKKVAFHLEIERKLRYFGTTSIKGDQELEEILDLICGHLVELMDAYTCHIRLLDADTGEFVLRAGRGRVEKLENVLNERKPYGEAYSGMAAETKTALNIDDIQDNQFFKNVKESALSRGEIGEAFKQYLTDVRSAYVMPVSTGLFGDEIDAVLSVTSDVPAFFTAGKIELVDEFVNQIVIAVTKYWLKRKGNETLSDHRNISDMLGEVSDELKGEPDKIYEIVFKRISAGLKPEVISIFRYDEQVGRLVNVDEFRGNQRTRLIGEEYAPGDGLVGRIYSASTPLRINIKQDTDGRLTANDSSPEGLSQERVDNILSGGIR
ncbi:MAG TPA: response regulator, partial [Pyrinomonadaceae bacterium]|nr:response regulator [Pyrinomonadaceae bacterium]